LEVPRKRDGLHVRDIDGETVVLDPETERMHTLNATAAFVFGAIDGNRSVKEISEDLAKHFEVEAEVAARDAREIVRQFCELDLVV